MGGSLEFTQELKSSEERELNSVGRGLRRLLRSHLSARDGRVGERDVLGRAYFSQRDPGTEKGTSWSWRRGPRSGLKEAPEPQISTMEAREWESLLSLDMVVPFIPTSRVPSPRVVVVGRCG